MYDTSKLTPSCEHASYCKMDLAFMGHGDVVVLESPPNSSGGTGEGEITFQIFIEKSPRTTVVLLLMLIPAMLLCAYMSSKNGGGGGGGDAPLSAMDADRRNLELTGMTGMGAGTPTIPEEEETHYNRPVGSAANVNVNVNTGSGVGTMSTSYQGNYGGSSSRPPPTAPSVSLAPMPVATAPPMAQAVPISDVYGESYSK
jgi:hypothetical protein